MWSTVLGQVRRILAGHAELLGFVGLVGLLSAVNVTVDFWLPDWKDMLASSSMTPWGFVTAIVVHSGAQHFLTNMASLTMLTVLFVGTHSYLDASGRARRGRTVVVGCAVVAVVTNASWAIGLPGSRAVGASTVVYALVGLVWGYSISNLTARPRPGGRFTDLLKHAPWHYVLNGAVALSLMITATTNPIAFLSVAPGVNVFAHGISFIGPFIVAMFDRTDLELCSGLRDSATSAVP